MLEYLIFTLNPPFQGELRVQVRVYDGSVQVTVESEDYPAENGDTWLEGEAAQRFLQALQNVRISGWRSAYAEDGPQDGMTWSIEYKQAGKHCRTISGRNGERYTSTRTTSTAATATSSSRPSIPANAAEVGTESGGSGDLCLEAVR